MKTLKKIFSGKDKGAREKNYATWGFPSTEDSFVRDDWDILRK